MQDHRTALLSALATASWHLSQIDSHNLSVGTMKMPVDGLQWMLTVVETTVAASEGSRLRLLP